VEFHSSELTARLCFRAVEYWRMEERKVRGGRMMMTVEAGKDPAP